MKRGKLVVFGLLFLLTAALVGRMYLAGRFEPSEMFREGYYTLPSSSLGGENYEFHAGRFQYISFSCTTVEIRPLVGQYDVSDSRVRLTFNDPKHRTKELYWRNVGGVPVLLTSKAAAIYDSEKQLVSYTHGVNDFAEFYVFKRKPAEVDRLWFTGLVQDYPEFAKALPERERYAASWWQYQRMRWRYLPYEHPELYGRLPEWLKRLL